MSLFTTHLLEVKWDVFSQQENTEANKYSCGPVFTVIKINYHSCAFFLFRCYRKEN